MEILRAIIGSLAPDAPVEEVRRGLFWTAVVSRHCGLASAMIRDSCAHGSEDGEKVRSLTEKSARSLHGLPFWMT